MVPHIHRIEPNFRFKVYGLDLVLVLFLLIGIKTNDSYPLKWVFTSHYYIPIILFIIIENGY
jgi:hypothetical protein